MKYDFKIGQLVTPIVKGEEYELGNHERVVGKYYEITNIDTFERSVKLAGERCGWLKFEDVKIKIEKENYNYLKKLLKKLNIK